MWSKSFRHTTIGLFALYQIQMKTRDPGQADGQQAGGQAATRQPCPGYN